MAFPETDFPVDYGGLACEGPFHACDSPHGLSLQCALVHLEPHDTGVLVEDLVGSYEGEACL